MRSKATAAWRRSFAEPPVEFRGAPFWSWNDDLEEKEIRRQVRLMKDGGYGGFFMHPRYGMVTRYLGRKYMKIVRAAVDEAKRAGLAAWLYDEDRWPSGYAGGLLLDEFPEFRVKTLQCTTERLSSPRARSIGTFRRSGRRRTPDILYFYQTIDENDYDRLNYTNYVDLLNPGMVDAFVDITHERYKTAAGADFGGTVPGLFTDEPHWRANFLANGIPWTEGFQGYFRARKGYDICAHLPELFLKVGDYRRVRLDYWSTLTDLLVESFSARIYKWCDANGLKFTGHYNAEDTLLYQIMNIGAAMPHYEYMHYPGVDHLGLNIEPILTMKQVSSVARQLGKPRVLSELYAGTGWDFSFEEEKWIGDWEYVLGVNLRCPHLCHYSLRGGRKRDFPPSLFYQQPWFRFNSQIEDYFARLGYMLTRGERIADILVIHPAVSAWTLFQPETGAQSLYRANTPIKRINDSFYKLSKTLLEIHRDYDFGDETLMAKYGTVDNRRLLVRKTAYRVVIIPAGVTLLHSTPHLLERFVSTGGTVVAVKPVPTMVDGVKSEELAAFLCRRAVRVIGNHRKDLEAALSGFPRDVEIVARPERDSRQIYCQHRRERKRDIYFFANTALAKSCTAVIRMKGSGHVERWIPDSGEIDPVPYVKLPGIVEMRLAFAPGQSHLIVRDSRLKAVTLRHLRPPRRRVLLKLDGEWETKREDPNALVLDYCRYKFKGGRWSEVLPVWRAQADIRRRLKLPDLRGNQTAQPWRVIEREGLRQEGKRIALKFTFTVSAAFRRRGDIFLAMESPEAFDITLNGAKLHTQGIHGRWVDTSFRKVDARAHVRAGRNELTLSCDYRETTELEAVYLIGDFAVTSGDMRGFVIENETNRMAYGAWTARGYPFYAGTMTYRMTFSLKPVADAHVYVRCAKQGTVVNEIVVNGHKTYVRLWAPYDIEVTNYLRGRGENEIRVYVTNSLRNLLGPHHHDGPPLTMTGPTSFSDERHWTDRYILSPDGLGDVSIYAVSSV